MPITEMHFPSYMLLCWVVSTHGELFTDVIVQTAVYVLPWDCYVKHNVYKISQTISTLNNVFLITLSVCSWS